MKTFFILALLVIVATNATTAYRGPVVQLRPQNPCLQQPQEQSPLTQQEFPGKQQPFPPQQPYPQPQPFPPQQPYPQPQPFPPQQPYPQQQPFPQPQPFPPQQPYPQPQPFPPQQPYPQPQPQYPQSPQILQPFLQQQLIPCRDVVLQQHNIAQAWSQVLQQSSYQQLKQQCCQQLWQIPEQSRCQAIHSVVHAIILHQQQQQQQQQYPSGQSSIQQPEQQYPSVLGPFGQSQPNPQGLGSVQPQQLPQFEEIRKLTLQTLPTLCNVYVPPYCSTTTVPFGSIGVN
uniref:Prolamin n=1 Tax=Thinopyrum elongatum TaxID=4588 RepID=E5FF02_THIEL|nr:alpha-gliadin [Thinopyrum elongatum]